MIMLRFTVSFLLPLLVACSGSYSTSPLASLEKNDPFSNNHQHYILTLEAIQTAMDQHHQNLRERWSSWAAQIMDQRRLFTTSEVSPRRRLEDDNQCQPSVIYAEDDDSLTKYAPRFDPQCTCSSDEPNITAVLLDNNEPANHAADLDAAVAQYNDLLGDLQFREENVCANDCASCYHDNMDETCATVQSSDTYEGHLTLSRDLTAAELLALTNDSDALLNDLWLVHNFTLSSWECFDFVALGKACFSVDINYAPDPPVPFAQVEQAVHTSNVLGPAVLGLTLDGTACASCEFDVTNANPQIPCVKCDCTNVYPNANPNECVGNAAATFNQGLLAPLYTFGVSHDVDPNNFTRGNCGHLTGNDLTSNAPAAAKPWFAVATSILGIVVTLMNC